MKNLSAVLSRYAKFIAAIVGAVTEAINLNLLPHAAQNYVSVAVSILTALGVAGITNGPSPDVVGAVNDIAALKAQLAPLQGSGFGAFAKHLADLAEHHAGNLEAIAANLEEHIKALVHGAPVVSAAPPTTEGAPVTVSEPTTPGAEPDHLAALAAMLAPPSNIIP